MLITFLAIKKLAWLDLIAYIRSNDSAFENGR